MEQKTPDDSTQRPPSPCCFSSLLQPRQRRRVLDLEAAVGDDLDASPGERLLKRRVRDARLQPHRLDARRRRQQIVEVLRQVLRAAEDVDDVELAFFWFFW